VQREKESRKQEKQGKKKGRGILGCIGCLFSLVFLLVFIAAFLLVITASVLYFNCSRPSGHEFIPKSRDLCQDIYQMLQTGRIAPLSWDYKTSLRESGVALQVYSNNVLESIRQFDYIGWKNAIIDTTLTCRDTIVRLSIWTYEHGTEAAKPIFKQLVEWFWVAVAMTVFALDRAFHYAVQFGKWTIESVTDVVNNFPTYWEKVKFYWKNMK